MVTPVAARRTLHLAISLYFVFIRQTFAASTTSPNVNLWQSRSLGQTDPLDDLRVSNTQFDGNFHTIQTGGQLARGRQSQQSTAKSKSTTTTSTSSTTTPTNSPETFSTGHIRQHRTLSPSIEERMTNHIGKPLVVLPPKQLHQQLARSNPIVNSGSINSLSVPSTTQEKKYSDERSSRQLQEPTVRPTFSLTPTAPPPSPTTTTTTITTTTTTRTTTYAAATTHMYAFTPTSAPADHSKRWSASLRGGTVSGQQLQQQQQPPQQQQPQHSGRCRWLSLAEFSTISLENEELLARDSTGQPVYLVSMRAYVMSNELNFIPLRNFRAPVRSSSAYRWWPRPAWQDTNDGEITPPKRQKPLPLTQLNCTVPNRPSAGASLASVSLTSNRGRTHPDSGQQQALEQLTIQVDCGYLVLDLLASSSQSSSQVELVTISFYQNWGGELQSLGSPFEWRQHLVFTTDNVGPLIRMPQFSRYACERRTELSGGVPGLPIKLVLDKFELQRLITGQWSSAPAADPSELANGFERFLTFEQLNNNNKRDKSPNKRPWEGHHIDGAQGEELDLSLGSGRRRREATIILYKNPIVGVTKCPEPLEPGLPLRMFMDLNNDRPIHESEKSEIGNNNRRSERLQSGGTGLYSPAPTLHVLVAVMALVYLSVFPRCRLY